MDNKDLKKMNRTADIVTVVLAVILIGSIAFSVFCRKDNELNGTEQGGTQATVIDTTAPAEDLKAIGSAEIPTEEGVYREVLEVADEHGNESKATFLIIEKEGSATQTGNGGATTSNGGSSSQGGNTNSDTNKKPSNNQDISTWDPSDYDENEINPYQQMLIDAGYGNVVQQPDGTYAVLVHKGYQVNGKDASDIMAEYLAAKDLEAVGGYGGIIDEANDWYVYSVYEVRELITPDEDEFWD